MSEETKERKLTIAWLGKTPCGKFEIAQVLEQSHRDYNFAPASGRKRSTSNKWSRFEGQSCVNLYSGDYETGFEQITFSGWCDFNVLGRKQKTKLSFIPLEFVQPCKDAVTEYNETNGIGYAAVEEREKKEREEREAKEASKLDEASNLLKKCFELLGYPKRCRCSIMPYIPAKEEPESIKIAEIKRRVASRVRFSCDSQTIVDLQWVLDQIKEVENQ